MQVNDWLDAVLLGCFFFGLLLSVSLLFIGDGGVLTDLGVEAGDGNGPIPINLGVLMAFVAWFGGVGFLARNAGGWPLPVTLAAAIAGGVLGAFVAGRLTAAFVSPKAAVLDPADYRLPGTIARVTSSIRENGVGEVVYEQAGIRQVSAARAAGGTAIPQGAEVVVLETRAGIALVEPSDRFFGEPDGIPIHGSPETGTIHPNPE